MKKMTFATLIAIIILAGTAGVAGADSSQASVRFVHTVPGVPSVDIAVIGGPVLVTDLTYPNASPYLSVAPGTYDIELLATGTTTVLVRILGWHAVAGVTTTVRLVKDGAGHLIVDPMTDLPHTGAGSSRLALVGLGLIIAGLVMFLSSRRAVARTESG